MTKLKSIIAVLTAGTMLAISSISISANNDSVINYYQYNDMSITTDTGITYTVDDGGYFDGAMLLSEEINNTDSYKYETIRTYQMPDGTICTDSLIVEKSKTRSSDNGQVNNVTHSTDVGMATVSIISSFDWYTSGSWSYVRCSNMTAYYSAKSTAIQCNRFNKSKSEGYIKAGKAWAKVDYSFVNKNVPGSGTSGTFKVTCTDSGTISA